MSSETKEQKGALFVVGTPIGNLEDITLRALRILKEVDLIAAESPLRTLKLLSKYEIHTSLTPYREQNKARKTPQLIKAMKEGRKVALVSDAGTPCLRDPGSYLVDEALRNHLPVYSIPGSEAVTSALAVSGLDARRFLFEGFLPRRKGERRKRLMALAAFPQTLVFFEAPHRLLSLLEDLREIFPQRPMAIVRELTKVFEETLRGTPDALLLHFQQKPPRGEMVVILEGAKKANLPLLSSSGGC